MTHLRQLMIEELRRRNFAESTIRSYVHGVEHFSKHFHRRPDHLARSTSGSISGDAVQQVEVQSEHGDPASWRAAVLLHQGMKKNWSVAETPYPRKVIRLPKILSPEEVTRLIDAADSMFHRAMLMTLYATGARRARRLTEGP